MMTRGTVIGGSTRAENTELLRSSQDTQALSPVQNIQTVGDYCLTGYRTYYVVQGWKRNLGQRRKTSGIVQSFLWDV